MAATAHRLLEPMCVHRCSLAACSPTRLHATIRQFVGRARAAHALVAPHRCAAARGAQVAPDREEEPRSMDQQLETGPPSSSSSRNAPPAAGSSSGGYPHVPVLLTEVLQHFQPVNMRLYLDCTLGAGGHAVEVAKAHPVRACAPPCAYTCCVSTCDTYLGTYACACMHACPKHCAGMRTTDLSCAACRFAHAPSPYIAHR